MTNNMTSSRPSEDKTIATEGKITITCPDAIAVSELRKELAEMKRLLTSAAPGSANDVLNNEELIATYKISRTTASEWRNSGKLAYYKIGRLIMYKRSDIETFLQTHRHKTF